MRKTLVILALSLGLAATPGLAQAGALGQASPAAVPAPATALLPDDPAALLGMGLAEAIGRFGPPLKVEVVRGNEAWQDDVVFVYGSGASLYWAVDRLWQIRLGAGYPGSVLGVFIGDAEDKVVSILGTPYYSDAGNLVFRLPYRGYPVRLRVALAGGVVTGLFIYRADF